MQDSRGCSKGHFMEEGVPLDEGSWSHRYLGATLRVAPLGCSRDPTHEAPHHITVKPQEGLVWPCARGTQITPHPVSTTWFFRLSPRGPGTCLLPEGFLTDLNSGCADCLGSLDETHFKGGHRFSRPAFGIQSVVSGDTFSNVTGPSHLQRRR